MRNHPPRTKHPELAGLIIRCYGSRTGTGKTRCGWVGDSGDAHITPGTNEPRCPKCGGSTCPPPRGGGGRPPLCSTNPQPTQQLREETP